MKIDAADTRGFVATGLIASKAPARRDPGVSMAQGIFLGAIGGLSLWALVGAVLVSVF